MNDKRPESQEFRKHRKSQYLFVIRELSGRELKRKYSRSKLGIVWSVLNPLLSMIIISFIFSEMFARDIEKFPVYYLCGSVLWSLFTVGTNTSISALVDNRQMLIKVKIPMRVFVISRVYTAFINFLYSLIAFVPILIFFKVQITWAVCFTPVIVAFLVLFTLGISYILSIAYVFFGDIKHLYGILLTLWMYLSAIFYPVERIPEFMQVVVSYNPLFIYIDSLRSILLNGSLPELKSILLAAAWGLALYFLGLLVFKKNQNKVMQKI